MQAPELPLWGALIVALLLLLGAAITLIGSIGLLRLRSFQQRMHAPTLGSTLGTGSILLGSMICFSLLQSRLAIHEILVALFLTLTTPVGFMLLARAALFRSRERAGAIPDQPPRQGETKRVE
ncbi:MAG: potassium:proton antiporter [Alphaproteobacteria bacterium 65-7]|nr:MAG: potassium:proton antiporter [Alphaproteobacteria bacterium 65-7]